MGWSLNDGGNQRIDTLTKLFWKTPSKCILEKEKDMLRFIPVVYLTALIVTTPLFPQQMEDVVHLKNGSVVRGTIIERIPGQSLKIQTQGGSVFVYAIDEIAQIAKKPVMETEEAATGAEIGTLFGFSHLSSDGDGITMIGAPGGFIGGFGTPSLYVSWFPSEKLTIGPEFNFGRIAVDGDGITSLYLGGRGAFFPNSNALPGVYILGQSALIVLSDEYDSETDFSAGAGLGYQWRLGPAFVLRAEGRYRLWFEDEVNDFSLLLGLGTRLNGK